MRVYYVDTIGSGGSSLDLRELLMHYKKKNITLDELQQMCPSMTYDMFRSRVQQLQDQEILSGVRSSGNDFGVLFRKYHIMVGSLFAESAAAIQKDAVSLGISGQVDISWYYSRPLTMWQRDKADIEKLNRFLAQRNQEDTVSLQQRSYDIFGNEKLLTGQGHALLSRLHINDESLGIMADADPLMMAVNPAVSGEPTARHLIVENKATYYGLLPYLQESGFTSLILGYGWKIIGNISQLPAQCCSSERHHLCWYFGDFDWEGLRIWHSLPMTESMEIQLAVPFYKKFLAYSPSEGKMNQKPDEAVLYDFLAHFNEADGGRFRNILKQHFYYPQEALSPEVLQACWKELRYETGKLL